jgi:hypothetical protein
VGDADKLDGLAIIPGGLRHSCNARGQMLDRMDVIAFLVVGQTKEKTDVWSARGFGGACKKLDCRVSLARLEETPGIFYGLGWLPLGRRAI